MRIALFGATGQTGQLVLDRALQAGHEITALVRNPAKMGELSSRLHIVQGDVLDQTTVQQAIQGADAVISVIGARTLKPDTICSDSARNVIAAMTTLGLRRFVCISGAGLGDQAGFIINRIIRPLILKNVYADALAQDRLIQQSNIDWTIVRPYRLINAAPTASYSVQDHPFRSPLIIRMTSRADVADFMVKTVGMKTYSRAIAFISTRAI